MPKNVKHYLTLHDRALLAAYPISTPWKLVYPLSARFTEEQNLYFSQCIVLFLSTHQFCSPAVGVHLHLPWDWHDCGTDTHSVGCEVMWCPPPLKITTKDPFKTQNYNWACHCVRVSACVYVCLCVRVYPTWAECRHQAQTSSICTNSTAIYKAQTSNITAKLHSPS